MHWYDWLLIAVLLIFVYKRAEGYFPVGGNFAYDGSLDSRNIPGGRPAEIFTDLSPSEWQEKDVSYAHTSNKVSCDTK
jgi:hypothetical protein